MSGRRLLLVRVAWVALTAVVVGLHAAGIPYFYASQIGHLNLGRFTSEQVLSFGDLALMPQFYAAYTVTLPVGTMLVFTAIATVIFWRKSDDRMALFAAFTLVVFGGAALTSDVPQALAAAHPSLLFPVRLLDYLGQVAFGVFFYVFPNGRFVPRWTRWLAVAVALLFIPDIFFPAEEIWPIVRLPFLVFLGSLVVAQVYRYRRVSDPAERQQIKWVVFGISAALAVFLGISLLLGAFTPKSTSAGALLAYLVGYLAILLIPISIGIAVLRYRLFDVDIIINRTLVYGSLTAILAVSYEGTIVVLQHLLRVLTGQESQVVVVASTLAIAAMFEPLRRRIQGFVDRSFYRNKYDARKTLEAFSATLRNETDLEALRGDLVGAVRETMQPAHVPLWLRPETASKGRQTT